MSRITRLGAVVAVAGILGLSVTGPALADPGNFGQNVRMCANMMLPYDLNPDGSITMTMPGATSPMHFRTFGAMVTYMQSEPMCSLRNYLAPVTVGVEARAGLRGSGTLASAQNGPKVPQPRSSGGRRALA